MGREREEGEREEGERGESREKKGREEKEPLDYDIYLTEHEHFLN